MYLIPFSDSIFPKTTPMTQSFPTSEHISLVVEPYQIPSSNKHDANRSYPNCFSILVKKKGRLSASLPAHPKIFFFVEMYIVTTER